MKKPKVIKIKEARDGDRALMGTTFWVVLAVTLGIVLLKKFETVSKAVNAYAQLSTAIAAILLAVSLFTKVRPAKVAREAQRCAMLATALWYAPHLLKNFEEGWSLDATYLLPFAITEAGVAIVFWLYIRFFLEERTW